jgi:hypothetical protein
MSNKVPKYAITERALKKLMKKEAEKHSSLGAWAIEHDITPQVVSAFIRKIQSAGLQIPAALGYKPQVVYIPLDEPDISTANPPRRPTSRPTSKVDHTREPIEKKHLSKKNDRDETKKRLKKRAG